MLFQFMGALYMLLSGTVSLLINYISLYVCIMLLVLLLALIRLRYTHPEREEPFKVGDVCCCLFAY